jgi:hypothetical protein
MTTYDRPPTNAPLEYHIPHSDPWGRNRETTLQPGGETAW